MDLLYYYNHVFLEQVEEIIANPEQAQSVLNTPVRMERRMTTTVMKSLNSTE